MNYLSDKGAAFIRKHEGFVPEWYLDPVGIPTIGIGFTWRSSSFREWWGKFKAPMKFDRGATMTLEEAEDALQYLVDREYGKAVNDFLGREVPENVFTAMVSAVFNLGPGSLKWSWAQLAKAGDYKAAAARLRSTGTTAGGKVLRGLVKRRAEEAALLESVPVEREPAPFEPWAPGIIKVGAKGAGVKYIQRRLVAHGYRVKVDGDFGPRTQEAVEQFQGGRGLIVDGIVGPRTFNALEANPLETPAKADTSGGTFWDIIAALFRRRP